MCFEIKNISARKRYIVTCYVHRLEKKRKGVNVKKKLEIKNSVRPTDAMM